MVLGKHVSIYYTFKGGRNQMKTKTLFGAMIVVTLCMLGCTSVKESPLVQAGHHAQTFQTEIVKTIRSDYMLYLPDDYATTLDNWPLILFLHGAGERGSELNKVAKHGLPKRISQEGLQFPFVILSPQCPEGGWWPSELQVDTLKELLDDIVSRYRIDQDRIYVTGLSMGGMGTWQLAEMYPDRFAAIAPICGGGNPECAESIAHLPVWAFHGAKDDAVPLEESEKMVAALKKANGRVKFTVYPDTGHNAWTPTYKNPELYEWLLKHTRSDNERYKAKSRRDASGSSN